MPETPDTFFIVNLGCKVNRVEADTAAAALVAAGMHPAAQELADVIVVNTCTVTGEADRKARKAVRHALSVNRRARIVVSGCAVAIDPDAFRQMDDRVEVVARGQLVEALGGSEGVLRMGSGFRTRVSIKVQDGCNHACTYCIVHTARGKAQSTPLPAVVEEACGYFAAGVKELVLAGIDIGSYRYGSAGLTELLSALLDAAEVAVPAGQQSARVRVGSVEPLSIDDNFVRLLAQSGGRVCRHVHLPLQSGSSKVLAEMGRPYDAERYLRLVGRLRAEVPSISISTDIIVGFPGETDDDFSQTVELARACGFSKIHVFPYSRRAGTPAAERGDQVDAVIKARRARELRALSDELRAADRGNRAGTTELALVEDRFALAESYHELAVPAGARIGDLVPVTW